MDYITDLLSEVSPTACAAIGLTPPANPLFVTNQFTSMQGGEISIVEDIIAGRLGPEGLIYEFGEFPSETGLGIQNWDQRRIPFTIHWWKQGGVQSEGFGKMLTLAQAFNNPANSFTTFEVFDDLGRILTDYSAPLNRYFHARSQAGFIGAAVKWPVGWLINFSPIPLDPPY